MRRSHRSAWLFVALVAIMVPACRKKQPVTSSPPPPIVLPPEKKTKPKEPPLPPAPKIESPEPEEPPVKVEVEVTPPPKPAPTPRRRTRATKKAAPPPETKTAEAPKAEGSEAEEAKPAVPPVRLGVILTPEQTKELARRLDAALERTRNAVVLIEGKLLTKEQKETLTRIRSFIAQAEQTRERDLTSSVSLADRADLLSRDLLENLR